MSRLTKTPYSVRVATHNLYPIYRVVWAYKGHFYVKYKGQEINVDKDINDHNYHLTESIRR